MRRLILSLALPATLAACAAPGPTLEQRLATFINRSEGELVAQLGVPVRTYQTEGRRFLEFEHRQTVVVPGDPWFYGPYGYRRSWAAPSAYAVVQCNMTFAIRNDRVESFTARGEGCH